METLANPYLVSSSVDGFKLEATTGKEIIYKQKDLFVYIDPDFKNFGLDKGSEPTKETQVASYDLAKDGAFKEIFEGFNLSLEKLSLSINQIIDFVKENKDSLIPDWFGTFFLTRKLKNIFLIPLIFLVNFFIKKNKINYYKYFVVFVYDYSDGLSVSVRRFKGEGVSSGTHQHRVIVPKLD